ncbi:Protein of unknown function [Pyronema omphalodes CBS 100304]|uniref:Uncharacterized protein n=1 Tax=Pyronema omphalodes (strain CBS 100304) TaxID=1076935 RepID=U4KW23_PYROM|nr:Protein of unknown function [Pyronema omphalodes CBS 100304]
MVCSNHVPPSHLDLSTDRYFSVFKAHHNDTEIPWGAWLRELFTGLRTPTSSYSRGSLAPCPGGPGLQIHSKGISLSCLSSLGPLPHIIGRAAPFSSFGAACLDSWRAAGSFPRRHRR